MSRRKSLSAVVFEKAEQDFQNLKDGKVSLKLMAIIAYKDHTSETISKIFKISQRHFLKIVHDYQAFGIEGLIQHPRGHNASKLNESRLEEIKQWILESKTSEGRQVHWTLLKLKNEIKRVYNIDISTVAIWNHLHAIGLVVKMPRPTHYKGNKEMQDEFKKKLNSSISDITKGEQVSILFFDEGRFGLQSTVSRMWGEKGKES